MKHICKHCPYRKSRWTRFIQWFIDCDSYRDVNGYTRYDISKCDYWWILILSCLFLCIGGLFIGHYVCLIKNFDKLFDGSEQFVTDKFEDADGNVYSVDRIFWGRDYQLILELCANMCVGLETNIMWKSTGRYERYGQPFDGYNWWLHERKKPTEIRREEYVLKKKKIVQAVQDYLDNQYKDILAEDLNNE